MALQKTLPLSGNTKVQTNLGEVSIGESSVDFNAYIKVEQVTGTKDLARALVSFSDEVQTLCRDYEFIPSMDTDNFIKQAYEHLKTLPEFADAVDV